MTAETMMQNPNPRCWLITTPQGGDLHVCAADGWRVEEIIGGARMDENNASMLANQLSEWVKAARANPNNEIDAVVFPCESADLIIAALRAKEPGSAGPSGMELMMREAPSIQDAIDRARMESWAACREAAAKELINYLGYCDNDVAVTRIRAIQPPKE